MAETATAGTRKKKQEKLRVIEPNAPKHLRAQARKVYVVALEKGYYNHRRVKPGTEFKMLVIGDESLPLPRWVAPSGSEEANELLHEIEEANRPRNLPPGVSKSRATLPEDIAMRRWKTDDTQDDEDEDDDDDDDESGAGAGGGGGRQGSDRVI